MTRKSTSKEGALSEKINVLLAGSEEELSADLQKVLEKEGWINVVGSSDSTATAKALAEETSPEIIVMDLEFAGDGIKASQELLKVSPDSKIIVLSIYDYVGKVDVHSVSPESAAHLDSIEWLSKQSKPAELLKTISKTGKKTVKRRIQ